MSAITSPDPGREYRRLFANWPAKIPKTGLLVTSAGESIPFVSYQISGDLLLLERRTPDAQGARRVILSFEVITALKILDAIEMPLFAGMGFQPVP